MNKEIKEILEMLQKYGSTNDKVLLDYITNLQQRNNNLIEDFKRHIDRINELTEKSDNLQQENERLKENNSNMQEEMARTWGKCDDYKSRCEKAIEYINKYDNIKAYYEYVECGYDEYNYDDDFKVDLLNILQNGSEENVSINDKNKV